MTSKKANDLDSNITHRYFVDTVARDYLLGNTGL
jgi:hypothetical protein